MLSRTLVLFRVQKDHFGIMQFLWINHLSRRCPDSSMLVAQQFDSEASTSTTEPTADISKIQQQLSAFQGLLQLTFKPSHSKQPGSQSTLVQPLQSHFSMDIKIIKKKKTLVLLRTTQYSSRELYCVYTCIAKRNKEIKPHHKFTSKVLSN